MRAKRAAIGVLVSLLSASVAPDARSQQSEVPTRSFPDLVDEPKAPAPAARQSPDPPPQQSPPPAPEGVRWWPAPPPAWRVPYDAPAPVDSADRWDDRPTVIEGHVGFGTPYGLVGAALARDLVRYFGVVIGGGLGPAGPQAAAGVRVRVPLTVVAFGLEISWSGGPYESGKCRLYCFDDKPYGTWDFAHWLNLAPAIELRTQGGFNARIYGGYARLLNVSAGRCRGGDTTWVDNCNKEDEIGFFGSAFGAAF